MGEKLKQELEGLIPKLIVLGEDEKELKIWLAIFDDLMPDEQEELIRNLRAILGELSEAAIEKSA